MALTDEEKKELENLEQTSKIFEKYIKAEEEIRARSGARLIEYKQAKSGLLSLQIRILNNNKNE